MWSDLLTAEWQEDGRRRTDDGQLMTNGWTEEPHVKSIKHRRRLLNNELQTDETRTSTNESSKKFNATQKINGKLARLTADSVRVCRQVAVEHRVQVVDLLEEGRGEQHVDPLLLQARSAGRGERQRLRGLEAEQRGAGLNWRPADAYTELYVRR